MKQLAILGSTGSIGRQTLEVVRALSEEFSVYALSAQSNWELLVEQAIEFKPAIVVIQNEEYFDKVVDALPFEIQVYAGDSSISDIVQFESVDIVVNGIVGFAGLKPTLKAIEENKRVALANKETLVSAGNLISKAMRNTRAQIIPIDSEHSAIFQSLVGEFENKIDKIYLTASGGPFLGKTRDELTKVSVQQALNHPNWRMGDKISIDSATMINKGFEMIASQWLFDLKAHQIEILIHPESFIHSMVQFEDGSLKAQMSAPDMRMPIQYALTYPERKVSRWDRIDFSKLSSFHFSSPDLDVFSNISLAYRATEMGGIAPCVLNSANEVMVDAFLKEKISFLQISELNERILNSFPNIKDPSLEDYLEADKEVRAQAYRIIS